MNVDLDFSIVPRFFRGILKELHQKRLWPVGVLLLVAIVAVPVLLSSSSSPPPVAQVPAPTPPPASGTTLPTLNVQSTPSHSQLRGSAHDPFSTGSSTAATPAASGAATASSAVAKTATTQSSSGGTGTTGTAGASSGSAGSSTATSSGSSSTSSGTPSSNPPSITPGATPKPAPTGLTSKQAYDVALSITTSNGGVSPIDPLQRLSELPNGQQPQLIELGVKQGGNQVLFAVQPGTVLAGPGTCTPGPIDCEVLALGQDQTEALSAQGPTGVSQVALFAVTSIAASNFPTSAAADKARQAESSAGRALLAKSPSETLSLFQYEPSLGVVVDKRNLSVGG